MYVYTHACTFVREHTHTHETHVSRELKVFVFVILGGRCLGCQTAWDCLLLMNSGCLPCGFAVILGMPSLSDKVPGWGNSRG